MADLKPCPFCGKPPHFDDKMQDMSGPVGVYIGCLSCDYSLRDSYRPASETAQAIAAWNTRTEAEAASDVAGGGVEPFAWADSVAWHKPAHRAVMANVKLGAWLSAALDDPTVCADMKADIHEWFASGEPLETLCQALASTADLRDRIEKMEEQRDEAREQFDLHVAWASDQALAAEARIKVLEGALEAITERAMERDVKWAGMSVGDIARQALAMKGTDA